MPVNRTKEKEIEIEELQKQIGILRAEKFKIEKEQEILNEKNRILSQENQNLNSTVSQLKAESADLQARIQSLYQDKETLSKENVGLKSNIAQLEKEQAQAQNRIQILEAEVSRPKLRPAELGDSLRNALAKMEEGLKNTGGRVDYTVARFDADIKAGLSVGKENEVFVKLPYLGETISPEGLSVLKLTLKAVPKARIPLVKIPQFIGVSKNAALKIIEDLALKAEVQERSSHMAPGTVIDQKPEAYSEVPLETKVTLIVAVPEKIKVPNLIHLDKDLAVKIIKELDLELGKVETKITEATPNTVLNQSPLPAEEIERGSTIDLIVSVEGGKENS
jgi:regulator of replication initiation timing